MDGTATAKLRKNPERTANPFSRIFFCYVWPLMWRGYTCEMEPEDLPECVPHDESELCYKQLKSAWEREKALRPVVCDAETEPEIKSPEEKDSKKDRKKSVAGPSLGRALWSVHGTALLGLGVLLLLEEFVRLVQPLFLGGLVRYFRYDHPLSVNQAYFYASGIAICAALYPTIHHPFFYALQKCGLRMKVATSALVFDKALQLSSSALHSTSVGYVINLLSTDVSRFDFGLIFLHYIWVSPLMLIGYVILLWRELGPSCLAGFGALAVLVPIQGYFSRNMGRCRREIAARADKRIGLMSEILNGIRVIKMYAWEPAFAHLVHQARKRELRMVKKFAVWQSLVLGTFWASGRVVILSFLLAFLLAGNEVTAEKVFVSAALFNASRVPLTLFLPLGLQFFFEMKVAIDRLQKFLLLEEGSERTLKFRYGTLNTWRNGLSLGDAKTTLTEKSLDSTGQTHLDLSQNGVLNGEASQSEIDPLVDEETEIGNGVAGKDLSGEPFVHMVDYTAKWNDESASFGIENICLEARPGRLVAIIGPVGAGKSTILNAILGETMRKSGTLRVHGRVAYVPQEAWVFGATLQQNITFGMEFEQGAYDRAVRQAALTKDLKLLPMGDQTAVGDRGASLSGGQKARVNLARALYRDADVYLLDDPLSAVDSAVGRYLFDRCIKSLKANKVVILVTHQLQYLNAADFVLLVKDGKCVASGPLDQLKREHPMEFEQVVAEAEQTFKKEQSPRRRLLSQSSVDSQNRRRYATGASTGTVGTARAESVRASSECESLPPAVPLPEANATALAGNNLSDSACSLAQGQTEVNAHADDLELDKTAETVEQAEIADVLDASDSEERASGAVDWRIYWSYVCAMSGMPGLVLLALFVVGVQLLMCSCDWTTGSEQQRAFSKLNKTQIHQLSNCTDNNLTGSGNGTLKPECFDGKIVVPTGWYAFSQYDYLDVYAVICGLLVVGSVARVIWFRFFQVNASRRLHGRMFNAIVRTKVFFFDANPVGRVLNRFSKDTNAMDEQLAFVFFEFIQMVSVERILNYSRLQPEIDTAEAESALPVTNGHQETRALHVAISDGLPDEQAKMPVIRVDDMWPASGQVVFEHLSMCYEEGGALVLEDISCKVDAGTKVGVVGRTGAGKSSLVRALFRMNPTYGAIVIDGVDTRAVPLAKLRKRIGIIPQDPMLFTGSLRKNLDPFDEFTDERVWRALEQVELRQAVAEMPSGLETAAAEGGANLSVGQRQLICLARALLKRTAILVLDEATANVDNQTDLLIQRTLSECFAGCTVITVAHRLHTIMDADKVMVLEAGVLVEYDRPAKLLSDGRSMFSRLAAETGADSAAALFLSAKRAEKHKLATRD